MAKETTLNIIKTVGVIAAFVITMTTTVFLGGQRIGKAEQSVQAICETMTGIRAEQDYLKKNVSQIETKQAYQEGVVNTKLENLEKGIQRIENIVSQWEPK